MTETTAQGITARGRRLWQWMQGTRLFRTISHFTDAGGPVLAGGMSYQALFAVFAGLFVGFGVFGIVLRGHPAVLTTMVEQINAFVPGLIGQQGEDAAISVNDLLNTRADSWAGIIAAATLLWIAVNWFTGTRRSIRLIFELDVKEYRNALLLKVRDFLLALGFSIAILVSAVLTVVSSNLTNFVLSWLGADPDSWFFSGLGTLVRYGALYVFDLMILIAIHYFLAEIRVGRWNLLTGCMLGAAALFGIKLAGTALLGGATSNPLFATFVIFVGLLIWFNFICRALLMTSAWIATGVNKQLGLPEAGKRQDPLKFLE